MSLLSAPWFTRPPLVERTRRIAAVFSAHGLASILDGSGVRRLHWPHRGPSREQAPRPTQAQHLRLAFGELGVTFIKLGQMLSTRADLISAEFVEELSKLQDSAPPVPWPEVRATLVEELGAPPGERFARFDDVPMASASIGQVHGATLHDGREVVVKIRRPGVVEEVERDLELLAGAARWAGQHTAFGRDLDLPALVDEFAFTIRRELDYRREAQNAEQFRRMFRGDERVQVPRVFPELSTTRVLTLERLQGIKISDAAAIEREGIPGRRIAQNAVHLFLREILEFGFFHADPHPGNFFVRPDGSIALLDYGMVGRVSEPMQEHLLRAGLAAMQFDAEALADELYALGIAGSAARHEPFVRDLDQVLQHHAGSTLAEISATGVVHELTQVAYRHRLQLPSDLALLLRVIVMSDGLGLRLDPGFHFLADASPHIRRHWRARHAPGAMLRRLGRAAVDHVELGLDLPSRLARLLSRIERGQLQFGVSHEGLEPAVRDFERMINRLAIAVLLGASIVALGLAVSVGRPAGWPKFVSGVLSTAFPLTLVLGAWLVAGILRSGRRGG